MDRLMQAAQVGDTNELYNCIREEVDVRRCIDVDDEADRLIDQIPLHITAIGGHVDFAMALMYLKPSWGRKVNQELLSAMHLAMLYKHNKLVLALLAVDKDLVRIKGRDGYTALHYAAQEGNLEVLAYFLKDCPACLEDVTIQNETALHVAAKNDKLEALEILARYLRRTHLYCKVSKRHLLNSKDRNGNTVLHIAASNTQPEMMKLLLECNVSKKEINNGGLRDTDLLERQSRENPNREICLNIMHNARDRQAIMSPKEVVQFCLDRIPDEDLHKTLKYKITGYEHRVMIMTKTIMNMSPDKINALLVVLALTLTATYQAMLSPAGGVWQGSYSPKTTSAATIVGQSVMNSFFFSIFFFQNLLVFGLASVFTVYLVQVFSGSNFVALLSEILLSLLIGCLSLAEEVIKPNAKRRLAQKMTDIYKIRNLAFPPIIVLLILMVDIARRSFQRILGPPRITFLMRFFSDQM